MLPVVERPSIQYVVEEAVAAGIDDILIITGRNKRSLEDHFDRNFELEYHLAEKGKTDDLADADELGGPRRHPLRPAGWCSLGLGHAVSVAPEARRQHNPFVVLLGDDIMHQRACTCCRRT